MPQVKTEVNWRLGMFIDERASDEQVDKLAKVFGGQLDGPMAGLVPLVGSGALGDDPMRHVQQVGS